MESGRNCCKVGRNCQNKLKPEGIAGDWKELLKPEAGEGITPSYRDLTGEGIAPDWKELQFKNWKELPELDASAEGIAVLHYQRIRYTTNGSGRSCLMGKELPQPHCSTGLGVDYSHH